MKPIRSITIPEHWSPEQALAVFELLDELRDILWATHGPAIQQALREERYAPSSPPKKIHLGDDPVF